MSAAVTALNVRPFGERGDLDIDFTHADRPTLATQVLSRCVFPGESFWWEQSLGSRIAALLRLVVATNGRATLDLSARCTRSACANSFEFELPIDRLSPGLAEPIDIALGEGRLVRLRLPNGADLREWRARLDPARPDALTMLESLRLQGEICAADVAAIDAALSKHDPLVDFSIRGSCPACRADMEMPIDLEQLALAALRVAQRELLREVHDLASHYGWTEAEALAIPHRRRAEYRELIEGAR